MMNLKGKTNDAPKSREELNLICNCPKLKGNSTSHKCPKACYMLDNKEKFVLCKWVEKLKFPNEFACNLG